MRIVILGAPGSGKRTQASLLAEKYGLTTLTNSDLVKRATQEESDLGLRLRQMQEAGQPVTDDIILMLLQERLLQPDVRNGFMLDGFPRNLLQALTLDELLAELDLPLDFVLLIHIETDTLMERLVGRRTCRSCGAIYNIYTNPAVVEDVCDLCGGRLHQRAEYNEETVSSRLHVFDHLTTPLLNHYGKLGKLLQVDGDGEVEAVFARTCAAIEAFLAQRPAPDAGAEAPNADPQTPAPVRTRQPAKGKAAGKSATRPAADKTPGKKADTGQKKRPAKARPARPAAESAKPAQAKKGASTGTVTDGSKAKPKKAAAHKQASTSQKKKAATPAKRIGQGAGTGQVTGKKSTAGKASARPSAVKKKTPASQKKPTQKKSVQKAIQKKAIQKKAVQKKVVQKKVAQIKAVQKKSVQKKAVQKKAVQKKSIKKKPVQRASMAKSPPRKAVAKPAAAKKQGSAGKTAAAVRAKKKAAPVAKKKTAVRKPQAAPARKKAVSKKASKKTARKAPARKKA